MLRVLLALLLVLGLSLGVLAQEIPAPTEVNGNHPLARDLLAWWMVHPLLAAGPTWWTLVGQTHGTLTNMASGSGWQPATRPGSPGEMRFDGTDDYVSMPPSAVFTFDMTKNYSWAFWVKPQSFAEWHTLWAMLDAPAGSNYFGIYIHSTATSSWAVTNGISAGISTTGPFEIVHSTDNAVTLNTWQHLVVTYSGTDSPGARFHLYVNGIDVTGGSNLSGTSTTVTAGVVRLGNDTFGDPTLSGAVSQVGIWGRTLTPLDVQTLMLAAAPTYGGLLQAPRLDLGGAVATRPLRRQVIVP